MLSYVYYFSFDLFIKVVGTLTFLSVKGTLNMKGGE